MSGIVPSTLHFRLEHGLEVLSKMVRRPQLRQFEVRWPDAAKMQLSGTLLEMNEPHGRLFSGAFGV